MLEFLVFVDSRFQALPLWQPHSTPLLKRLGISHGPPYTSRPLKRLKKIQDDMKKIWKQNVFYDMGEVYADMLPVAWMDFKSFCLNGSLYNLLFLFDFEERTVLGNFHCVFSEYDIWKPVVLKLLTTIQID